MDGATSTTGSTAKSGRLLYIDLFRGMAILAVIGIHVLGSLLPGLLNTTFRWSLIATCDVLLQFAVPAFLMLTALLLTRSLLHKYEIRRYFKTRLSQTVPPFLLWSGIYLLFPENRQHYSALELVGRVLIGKASFHLYFLFVLLQLYVLVPFCLHLWRKPPPFGRFLLSTLLLTMGVYWSNRLAFRFQLVASVVFWYTPSIALGMWLGSQGERIPEILRRGAPIALLISLVSGGFFVLLSLKLMRHQHPDPFHYQLSGWLYFACAGFLVLWLAEQWEQRVKYGTRWLLYLGKNSMPIYIAHPLVLFFVKQGYRSSTLTGLVLATLLYGTTAIGLPLLLAWVASKLRLSALLFGRA